LVGREDFKIPNNKEANNNRPAASNGQPGRRPHHHQPLAEQEREPIMDTAVNDNQVSNNAAGTDTTQERSRAYPLRGHLSAVEFATDKNTKPYAKAKLTYTRRDQRQVTVTTMAFGKAFEDTQNLFKEGPVALYGTFERNVFRVISEALPPKEQAAA
jgi:hypothetical protein